MLGVDDNVLVPLHCDDLCVAVGITAMIYEACQPTLHCKISGRLQPCLQDRDASNDELRLSCGRNVIVEKNGNIQVSLPYSTAISACQDLHAAV